MTYLNKFKESTNNLDRKFQARRFNVDAVMEHRNELREGGDVLLQPDDIIVIGSVPGHSLVLGMQVLVNVGFDGTDAAFDFYFSGDYPTLAWTPIAAGVAVGAAVANQAIHVDLPTVGVVNGNSLWFGEYDDYAIIAQYKGTTESTVGNIDVLMDYDRFGTNEGAY